VGARVSSSLNVATRIQSETTAYYLARAGVERIIMDVAADTNAWDGLDEPWYNDEKRYRDVKVGEGAYSVSYELEKEPGKKETYYGVRGEESKININKAGSELLKAFLETAGGVDSMTASELASAICDWRDADDEPLTGGAENGYYQNLNPPYRCHNGEFESLHELLLVKGMGQALFTRIEPYMTVYGTGKVNLNTADATVLRSVAYSCGGDAPVSCESLAAKLLAFRNAGNVFRDPVLPTMTRQLSGAASLPPDEEKLFAAMMGKVTLQSTCFSGMASGKRQGRETEESRITFVFDRQRMVKLYWHER